MRIPGPPTWLSGLALALLAGCTLHPASTGVTARHAPLSSGAGDSGQADFRAIVRQIEKGPQELARQRAAARREGIPLTPRELQVPSPPPALNAAPVYVRLTRLFKDKPLDPMAEKIASELGVRTAHRPTEVASVRELLAVRQDVMTLVHQAASKPRCVFWRDWSLGLRLEYPEYPTMREAARLLKAESDLLAQEGRSEAAIANQTRGFQVAAHAASDPTLLGHLYGLACQAIALAGMEDILYQAGPGVRISDRIRATIAAHQFRSAFRRTWEGEIVMASAMTNWLRQIGPVRAAEWMSSLDVSGDQPAGNGAGTRNSPLTPEVQRGLNRLFEAFAGAHGELPPPARRKVIWNKYLDASEAAYLGQMRRMIAIGTKSGYQQAALYHQVAAFGVTGSGRPVPLTLLVMLPVFVKAPEHQLHSQAAEAVLMTSAELLAYKAQHGNFPDELEGALPEAHLDPFTGRPLKYRREGDGFVVYSVGADGHFDGGRPGTWPPRREAYFRYPAPPPRAR